MNLVLINRVGRRDGIVPRRLLAQTSAGTMPQMIQSIICGETIPHLIGQIKLESAELAGEMENSGWSKGNRLTAGVS